MTTNAFLFSPVRPQLASHTKNHNSSSVQTMMYEKSI